MNEDTNSEVSQDQEECDVDISNNDDTPKEGELSPETSNNLQTRSRYRVVEILPNPDYEEDGDINTSVDQQPEDDENDIIPVTCGHISGRLIKNRFHCPGINRPCIEYDGKLVTPKEFMHLGDKSRLKDWKNAIRINGRQIRKFIDSGGIDFYKHKEVCTGRCIARIPFQQRTAAMQPASSPNNSLTFDVIGSRSPQVTSVATIHELTYTQIPDQSEKQNGAATEASEVSINGEQPDVKPDINELNKLLGMPQVAYAAVSDGPDSEDVTYWRGIVEGGLIDEFFREIKTSLDRVRGNLIKFAVPKEEAEKATNVVTDLGLARKLNLRLAAHKIEVENQCKKVEAEVSGLTPTFSVRFTEGKSDAATLPMQGSSIRFTLCEPHFEDDWQLISRLVDNIPARNSQKIYLNGAVTACIILDKTRTIWIPSELAEQAASNDMKRQLQETEKKREILKRRSACFEHLMDIKMTKKPKLDAEKLDLQAGDDYVNHS